MIIAIQNGRDKENVSGWSRPPQAAATATIGYPEPAEVPPARWKPWVNWDAGLDGWPRSLAFGDRGRKRGPPARPVFHNTADATLANSTKEV